MKFSLNDHMAISGADFWCSIIELVTRNPNLGIPALEDWAFCKLVDFRYKVNEIDGR